MESNEWDDLLSDIEEQNAVLLLGREFLQNTQRELTKHLKKKLGKKIVS